MTRTVYEFPLLHERPICLVIHLWERWRGSRNSTAGHNESIHTQSWCDLSCRCNCCESATAKQSINFWSRHLASTVPGQLHQYTDQGFTQRNSGKFLGTWSLTSCTKNASGMPWGLPDWDLSGGLRSPWASTQTMPTSGSTVEWPKIDPIAKLWSPPSVRHSRPRFSESATASEICTKQHQMIDSWYRLGQLLEQLFSIWWKHLTLFILRNLRRSLTWGLTDNYCQYVALVTVKNRRRYFLTVLLCVRQ